MVKQVLHQTLSVALPPYLSIGDQIIDIQESAMHQILLHAKPRQPDRFLPFIQRYEPISFFGLTPPSRKPILRGSEERAQLDDERVQAQYRLAVLDEAKRKLPLSCPALRGKTPGWNGRRKA